MPNFSSVLKTEISRVARKELRNEIATLKKALGGHRTEIASLKRRSQALEQDVRRLNKGRPTPPPAATGGASAEGLRFSAKGLASLRRRLELSAHDCGRLLGVSGQTLYNWESGKARPQERSLPAIAALRAMGKRKVAARLAALP